MEGFYRSRELLHAGRPQGREPRRRERTTRRSRREEMEAASTDGGVRRLPHLHDGGILAVVLYGLDSNPDWIDPATGVETRINSLPSCIEDCEYLIECWC